MLRAQRQPGDAGARAVPAHAGKAQGSFDVDTTGTPPMNGGRAHRVRRLGRGFYDSAASCGGRGRVPAHRVPTR